MKAYIQAQGFQVWQSIVDGYTAPTVPPTSDKAVKLDENNSKAINALLNGLSDMVFTKVAHCKSAKEIWDKLQNIYEGDSKVKEEKLQTYRGQFEQIKMKQHENIAAVGAHQNLRKQNSIIRLIEHLSIYKFINT